MHSNRLATGVSRDTLSPPSNLSTPAHRTARRRRSQRAARRYFQATVEALEPRIPLAGNLNLTSATLSDAFGNALTAPMLGEQVFLRATWTTQGLAAADTYRLDFKLDGVALTPGNITLGAGVAGTSTWTQTWGGWYATTGAHAAEVRLDAGATVTETDETDNLRTLNFTTAAAAPPVKFAQPMGGIPLVDWTVVNYVDVDPRGGSQADYMGGGVVYDGHDAHDLTLANFARMDLGIPIFAAAAGTVDFTQDGNFDREVVGNSRPANIVQIDHGGGWKTLYFHMASGSIAVKVGDVVSAGQLIGLVGSSGSSTDAHLHFAILHNGGHVEPQYDPTAYWLRPRDYQLDQPVTVQDAGITNYAPWSDFKERPSDINVFSTATTWPLWFWFRLSHLKNGDSIQVKWYRPNGTLYTTYNSTANGDQRLAGYGWSFDSTAWKSSLGTWRVAVEMGGVELVSRTFSVGTTTVPEIRVMQDTTYVIDGRTTPFDFGSVAVGAAAPQLTWTIENHGSATLATSNLLLPPGFSLVGTWPTSVAAGATATFTLQLDTTRAGRKAGEVRFSTTDADESLFQFQVSGTVTGADPAGAPVVTLPGPAVAFIEGSAHRLLDSTATFSDADSPTLAGASVRVEFDSGADVNDRLGIRHQGTGAGQIGASGVVVTYGGTAIGSYVGGTNTSPLIIQLQATATPAAVQALLRSLEYWSVDVTSTVPRNVRITVTDDTGKQSNQPLKRVIVAESLTFALSASSIIEGRGTIQATIQRNRVNIEQSLVVTLTSSDTTEATVPATVTIPAGATSATFTITSVDDNLLDGDQVVTITGAVAGYITATGTITVYDDAVTRPLWVATGPVLSAGKVIEYSQAGVSLGNVTPPVGPGGDQAIRDLVVDSAQQVQIYTGTFTPYLTSLDPVRRTFSQITTSGWSSANVTTYGGIASYQGDIFVTDNETVSAGAPRGIVRFRPADGSATRFATDAGFADLTVGADARLYALDDSSPPKFIRVYDPLSLGLIRTISFPSSTISHRGIAVAANGDVYAAAWEGLIYRFDANWNLINLLDTGTLDLADIDLAADGAIVVTSSRGEVLLTDTSLSSIQRQFSTGVTTGFTFAAFARTPDTTSPALLLELSPGTVSESAGANLVQAKVTRFQQDLSLPLVVTLTSNDPSEATVPASVTIPAGEAVAFVGVSLVDDLLVDGPQNVTISAAASGLTGDSRSLTVTDNDIFSLTLASSVLSEGGGTTTGTVTRGDADLSAPLVVTLSSSDVSEATVPATVTIPAHEASATFTVTAVDDTLLDGTQSLTISASAPSHPTVNSSLNITDLELLTVTITPNAISENGGTTTATVTRSNTDVSSAITVTLSSNDPSEAGVPSQVTLPANATSTTFTVTGLDDNLLDGSQSVLITASLTGYVSVAGALTVTDFESLNVSLPTASISENGGVVTATVTRSNTDTASPLVVTLDSSDPTAATVPTSVTIPANVTFVTFSVIAVDDTLLDGTQLTTITATAASYASSSRNLQVTDVENLTVTIDLATISEAGGTATGTVTRGNTDRGSPLIVTLSSNDTTEATVPASVTIAAGEASATFAITAHDDTLLDGTQTVAISAAAAGYFSGAQALNVSDAETLTVTIVPGSVMENGGSATGTVTRSNTDRSAPLVVTLSSSDTTEASVPATVTIPSGQASVTFLVSGIPDSVLDGTQSVDITATSTGYSAGAQTIQVLDIETLSLTLDQSSMRELGGQAVGTVQRHNTDNGSDLVVTLTSSNSSAAQVPASVTIPAGQADATFTITAVDDTLLDGTQTVTITVSAAGYVTASRTIDVLDYEPLTVTSDVAAAPENGGIVTGRVTRGTSSVAASLVVTLTSSNTAAATVPATVTIPAGQPSVAFNITLIDDTLLDGNQLVTISASAAGFVAENATLTVTDVEFLALSISPGTMSESGGATTGIVTRSNTDRTQPLVVTLSSGDESEAIVPATVTIAANQGFATFAITAVDDNLLDGTQAVTISATASGYVGGSRVVNVTDLESLSLTFDQSSLSEAGGQTTATVTRSDGAAGGDLVITLSSADVSEVTVPATVTIPAGQASVTFVATAVDDPLLDGLQSATITASASGYADASATLQVTDVEQLSVTLAAASLAEQGGTTTGTVRRNNTDTGLALFVMLTTSDATAATVPASVTIPAGQATATFTVTAQDDTRLDGTQDVVIRASATGYVAGEAALQVTDVESLSLVVNPVSISETGGTATGTVTRSNTDVGSDLVVTLTNGDPTEATLPVSVVITAGSAAATFSLQAVDDGVLDGRQSVTITAAAAGYVSGETTLEVIDPRGLYQNPRGRLDTNDDLLVAPIDALIIVNIINSLGSGNVDQVMERYTGPRVYPDSNGDRTLSPLDALVVINYLNFGESEGEAAAADTTSGPPSAQGAELTPPASALPFDWFDELSADVARFRRSRAVSTALAVNSVPRSLPTSPGRSVSGDA
ncbi:MAG: Calx-beta domain-containing protein [Pirellulales bacterium]